MGNETILYYVTQDFIDANSKRHLPYFKVEQDNLTIYTIILPIEGKGELPKRGIKRQQKKCLRMMQKIPEEIARTEAKGLHDFFSEREVILQPEAKKMLTCHTKRQGTEAETEAAQEIPEIYWLLAEKALALEKRKYFDTVVLLLGNDMFPEQQMRHFTEFMQPFFSKINHLTILDGAEDEGEGMESRNEVLTEYTDEFYYEYGLMTQIMQPLQIKADKVKQRKKSGRQSERIFLDYGYMGELPLRMMLEGDVYLDITASKEKEKLITRKCAGVSYRSPLKYLDTTVKSGYDKLVNLRR
ncbi:MAG: hypothetical protein PUD93_12130 [Lachnospiraceae bacterium]|nr:hypothetical protein [Lachnospiraceae bacterium]